MEYRVQLNLTATALIVALCVGVSVVTSTVVAARAYEARPRQAAQQGRTITVKGSARRRIRSDLAVWRVDVHGEGESLTDAFAVLDAGVKRVGAFVTGKGFRPHETGFSAIRTQEIYELDKEGKATNRVARYRLERSVWVNSADVDRVNNAAGLVTELIQEAVFVASSPPEYYFTGIAELKVAMMGEASKDARARADEIAQNAGCSVAEVRDARMGVLQITRPFSTEVSDYGVCDTSSIDKDIQSVVTATFAIAMR